MDSGAGSANGADDGRAGPAGRLPPPSPIDLRRLEARRQEAVEFEALIGQVANGNEEALATLYDKAGARIYGLLLRILRSPTQATEMTQEVFAEVWRQARRYDPSQGMVFVWMITIAHQRAIDRVRANAGETASDRPPAQGNISREIDEVWAVIEQRFGSIRVRAGLKTLTWAQRQALLLAYFEGYSPPQVAAHLDIPLGTVMAQMRDGLLTLCRTLGVDHD